MFAFEVAAGTTTAVAGGEQPLDRKTVLALVAMGVAVFIVANDFTALAVALPAIEKQFDTDVGTVQWVINAYALTFGVLIVVGGRLADIFGRKRVFIIGAAIFASFSLLGGFAQDTAWLISCRALMGIGGAMMWPAILGMTFAALPDSRAGLAVIERAGIRSGEGPAMRFVTGFGILGALAVLTSPVVAAATDMRGVFVGSGASKFAEHPRATSGVQGPFRYQARLHARHALAGNPNAKLAVISQNDDDGPDDLSRPKGRARRESRCPRHRCQLRSLRSDHRLRDRQAQGFRRRRAGDRGDGLDVSRDFFGAGLA